jgi:hypothetical protein
MKKTIGIVAIILFLFASCKKTVTELPPATQTGANTFGAKVNGELWVPQSFGPIHDNTILEAEFFNNKLLINARNFSRSPNETEFEINITNVTGPGTYIMNTDMTLPVSYANYGYYVKRNVSPQDEWITSSTHTGVVMLTKVDTVNRIISGTFSFEGVSLYNAPQTISITDGRFDVKY